MFNSKLERNLSLSTVKRSLFLSGFLLPGYWILVVVVGELFGFGWGMPYTFMVSSAITGAFIFLLALKSANAWEKYEMSSIWWIIRNKTLRITIAIAIGVFVFFVSSVIEGEYLFSLSLWYRAFAIFFVILVSIGFPLISLKRQVEILERALQLHFKSRFGVEVPEKTDWKARSFVQPLVDKKLSDVAEKLNRAIKDENAIISNGLPQKEILPERVEGRIVMQRRSQQIISEEKNLFWQLHELAVHHDFLVKGSYKKYLTTPVTEEVGQKKEEEKVSS